MQLKIKDFEDVMLKALDDGLEYLLPLNGTSMEPFLHTGDLAIIKRAPVKKLDVILYKRSDGAYIFHRVLKIKKNFYLVTGDNQRKLEIVNKPQVLAVMYGFCHNKILTETTNKKYRFKAKLWSCLFIRRIVWLVTKRRYIKDITK